MHRKSILLFCVFAVIFIVVFFLYNLPVEAAVYPALLSAVVGGIIIGADYRRYRKKTGLLEEMKKKITVELTGLPQPANRVEEKYTELVEQLFENKCWLESRQDAVYREFLDYYTMWAHQIKTPIAAMQLLLQDQNDNGDLSEQLFKIEQYVHMVLQFLRSETMSSDLIIKRYSLDGIVKQAVRKYAKLFIRKKLILKYQELGCEILTDEKWAVFVVEQVLSNALKYANEGHIAIYLDQNLPQTLVIEDTGIGIQEEDIPRIFEKGFTGFNGHSDKKSTGIGLYLCQKVMKKLGHTITIESRVGEGTKVRLGFDSVKAVTE